VTSKLTHQSTHENWIHTIPISRSPDLEFLIETRVDLLDKIKVNYRALNGVGSVPAASSLNKVLNQI
jgi:hypothetical protein